MKISFEPNKELKKYKKQFILVGICAVLLIVALILQMISLSIIGKLPDELMADRWSGNRRMAQISLYVTEDRAVDENEMKRFDYQLKKKLTDEGVSDDDDDISNLYTMCYSAQGTVDISFENRTAENVAAIGVGGEFFLFHPFTLVSGSYFFADDIMKDHIVVDEDMAWQLFGSSDIIGQSVTIGGVPHYISGVIKREDGRMQKAAGLDRSYVYLSYDSLSKFGTILSGRTGQGPGAEDGTQQEVGGINCVQVVCPNPVDGSAALICRECLGIDDDGVSVIDNTDRFSFLALLKVLRQTGTRSMWGKAIYYPYWENIARGWEDSLAALLLGRMICIIAVVLIAAVNIVNAYRNKKWTVRGVARYIADKKYDFEAKRRKKLDEGEETL
ncbi:MAG: ABC transporter permease [Butyrivibrio sp.]|nr:ABC transporter permease [Butyrivibrio sp.]